MGVSREQAVDFIARMLALAENNPNENERQVALAKANEWLLRYNLQLDEIPDPNTPVQDRIYAQEQLFDTYPRYADFVLSIVHEFWFVRVVKRTRGKKNTAVAFGEPHNLKLAKRVCEYLGDQFSLGWKFYQLMNNAPNSHQQSYFSGVAAGFTAKLREQRNADLQDTRTRNALVVVDKELDEKFHEEFPYLRPGRSRALSNYNNAAYGSGYNDGRKLSVQEKIR